MVAELLKTLGVVNITSETTGGAAMAACAQLDPEVMVTELSGPRLNGLELVKTLRRCDLACRKIPVIMITAEATASAILAARDAGVHPREWVEAISYVGPDRRRFNSGDYKGPRKRLADVTQPADAERIRQALQILTSAIAAIESDPAQALRSMQAQAATLKACGVAGANMNLTMAAAKLQRALQAAVDTGRLARADIEAGASDLWAFRTGEVGEDDGNMLEL
jgi:CheY-like chemotaxis protein